MSENTAYWPTLLANQQEFSDNDEEEKDDDDDEDNDDDNNRTTHTHKDIMAECAYFSFALVILVLVFIRTHTDRKQEWYAQEMTNDRMLSRETYLIDEQRWVSHKEPFP